MSQRLALALVACTLALGVASCDDGDGTATTTSTSTQVAEGTLVAYERTGGVAGVSETLEVSPEGVAELKLGAPAHSASEFVLTPGELAELEAAVDAADLAGVSLPGGPSACADCFVYEIETSAGAVTYDDAQAEGLVDGAEVPDSVTALATELQELIDANR